MISVLIFGFLRWSSQNAGNRETGYNNKWVGEPDFTGTGHLWEGVKWRINWRIKWRIDFDIPLLWAQTTSKSELVPLLSPFWSVGEDGEQDSCNADLHHSVPAIKTTRSFAPPPAFLFPFVRILSRIYVATQRTKAFTSLKFILQWNAITAKFTKSNESVGSRHQVHPWTLNIVLGLRKSETKLLFNQLF